MKKYWLLLGISILAGLLLVAGSFALGRILRPPLRLNGAEINPSVPAVGFNLPASNGKSLDLRSLQGKIVLLYFGYSRCTLECPMVLQNLAEARNGLGAQTDQVVVVMVTLDPDYDTPPVLQNYLARYGDGFLGVAATSEETLDLALSNDLNYAPVRDGEIAHTPLVFLIDRLGYKRAIYPAGLSAGQIRADLQAILAEPLETTFP